MAVSDDALKATLLEAGVDPTRRAQTLSMADWGSLYEAFGRKFSSRSLDDDRSFPL